MQPRCATSNAAGADESGLIGESHEPETHLIPRLLRRAAGEALDVQIFGDDYPTVDGSCVRDYIHVNDLADARLRAMQQLERKPGFQSYSLGNGRGYTVKQVIAAVEAIVARSTLPLVRAAQGIRRRWWPAARAVLGWAVGHDARRSSRSLLEALARGLSADGAEVIDIGLCGTEEIYFATFHASLDGGIMVTASHNPADCNRLELVHREARPVSGDSGLRELEQTVAASSAEPAGDLLHLTPRSYRDNYVRHLLGYVDVARLKPLKLVVNAGNGTAGLVVDALAPHLPFEFVRVHHGPDPDFPNGIPTASSNDMSLKERACGKGEE